MLLACRHPKRVERLIVVDVAPKAYPGMAQRAEVAAMNELRLEGLHSRAEAEIRLESRVDDWAMRKFLLTNLERTADGGWRWIVNLPVLTQALPGLVKDPLLPADRYDGPTEFILGGRSRFVDVADHEAIRRHSCGPDSGHAGIGHNPTWMRAKRSSARCWMRDSLNTVHSLSLEGGASSPQTPRCADSAAPSKTARFCKWIGPFCTIAAGKCDSMFRSGHGNALRRGRSADKLPVEKHCGDREADCGDDLADAFLGICWA